MRIVVWGINYAPEQTGIAPYNAGLCEHLAASGHEVRMLTTFAYYPEWSKQAEDRGRLFRTDLHGGVSVHRCWHYVPRRPNAWKRILHEASFVATSWLRLLLLPRPDLLIAVSPPLLIGTAAWLGCLLKRCPFVFHVQDMQPDAAVKLGLLRAGLLVRVLYGLESLAYRRAAAVSGITPGMLEMFRSKGVPPEKLVLFPNWTQETAVRVTGKGAFRRRAGIPADAMLAVYSGNLGKKQGLDIVLDAAAALAGKAGQIPGFAADRPITIVIAGDGVEKPALAERVQREGLHNVLLLPLQPTAHYHELLADADVCLVTQQPGSGALFFPSKLLSILAHGRAVVAVADPGGELERAIEQGGFGWSARPGQPEQLARAMLAAAREPGECERRGILGHSWVRQFDHARVLAEFEAALRTRFGRRSHQGTGGRTSVPDKTR